MRRTQTIIIIGVVIILLDLYIWQAVKSISRNYSVSTQRIILWVFWLVASISYVCFLLLRFLPADALGRGARTTLMMLVAIPFLSKLLMVAILVIDDLRRGAQWGISKLFGPSEPASILTTPGKTIPRSEFLTKTALIAGGGLLGTFAFGIISGAYDYRVRRVRIALKNLPKEFDGIRIAQLSDIHSGSFFNKTAVKGGVDMMLAEKPDIAFFTGDLVNERAPEVRDYIDIFDKVKAPLGVYSTLGNHDYGDYADWPSAQVKEQNLKDLMHAHKELGWDLLSDEHRAIRVDGAEIGLLGIQNWGAGRFSRYGNLEKAAKGTDHFPVKLLLSHDPSHWNAQVTNNYKDIDVAFAGHTHGMQFGIELPGFRWSPAQYNYKQWAGLYQEGDQYIYVNRGYGFIGYPGRVGILPEITIVELVRA